MSGNKTARIKKAQHSQYLLRSKFLHRRLKETGLDSLINKVETYETRLDWALQHLGISKKAFEQITQKAIKPHLIFAHPKLILQDSRWTLYYRGIAGLSQKGAKEIGLDIAKIEETTQKLSDSKAIAICKFINGITSAIIEEDSNYSLKDARHTLLGTIAISLDGSWRNTIGRGAAEEVKSIIWEYINKRAFAIDSSGDTIGVPRDAKRIKLKNGCSMVVGSDPDIGVFDAGGRLIVAIEVKGGLDPAGALERYGAARKSFEKAKNEYSRCHTIYLVSCVTEGLIKRIEADRLVSNISNLIDILYDQREKSKFLKELFKYLIRIED